MTGNKTKTLQIYYICKTLTKRIKVLKQNEEKGQTQTWRGVSSRTPFAVNRRASTTCEICMSMFLSGRVLQPPGWRTGGVNEARRAPVLQRQNQVKRWRGDGGGGSNILISPFGQRVVEVGVAPPHPPPPLGLY